MQAAISRMAAASAPMGEAAWQAAAFPAAITGDPWELEGALSALADVLLQLLAGAPTRPTIFLLSFVFLCFLLLGLGHSFHEVVPPGTSGERVS